MPSEISTQNRDSILRSGPVQGGSHPKAKEEYPKCEKTGKCVCQSPFFCVWEGTELRPAFLCLAIQVGGASGPGLVRRLLWSSETSKEHFEEKAMASFYRTYTLTPETGRAFIFHPLSGDNPGTQHILLHLIYLLCPQTWVGKIIHSTNIH